MEALASVRQFVLASILIASSGIAAAQTTWYVDVHGVPPGVGTQAQPYTSIQYAIAQTATHDDDTLLVAPGEYVENLNTLNKDVVIRSSGGPVTTTIRPAQSGSTVVLTGQPELEGFTVHGNTTAPFTASIYVVNAEAYIRRCIVRDNSTGCGIMSAYDAWIYNCTVTGNAVGVRATNFGGMAVVWNSIVDFNGTDLIQDPGGALGGAYNVLSVPDPGFWDYAERDFHLRPGSIAIDAGDPNSPHDPDGSVTDAGALTHDPLYAPGPSSYCTGKLNSEGCTPAIGAIGSASASSANPFVVTAVNEVSNKPGLLLASFAKAAVPFQGGTLCVASPIKRLGGQNSGGAGPCTGSFAFDMQAHIQSGTQPGLVPGALVSCQWWNRDPLDPAGFFTGLSDALYFGIAP